MSPVIPECPPSDMNCVCVCVAGDGVLRGWLGDRPDQKHQRELSEGGVDRLHLQRDPQGETNQFITLDEKVNRC